MLVFDIANGTVTVPGANGKKINPAIEDIRPAIAKKELATAVQNATDELDRNLEEVVDTLEDDSPESRIDFTGDDIGNSDSTALNIEEEPDRIGPNNPTVGDNIEVYWPIDKKFYGGTVHTHNERTGKYAVHYFDGDKENLNLENEVWNYLDDRAVAEQKEDTERHSNQASDQPDAEESVSAEEVQFSPGQDLRSTGKDLIQTYYKAFGNTEFMLHPAQGLPPFATQNAYDKEERSFKKIVKDVPVSRVPKNANIVSSHVLYKVKKCDDNSLTLKARIAVHGNKDRDKHALKTDSATCPPVGIRILLSLSTIYRWTLAKIDFKSAFLQTEARRDVYMVPPRECKTRHQHYWLLLSAAYGLANAGAKWQELSDDVLRGFGFSQLVYVPQLFYKKLDGKVVVIAVKVVDDILFAGERKNLTTIIEKIRHNHKLGTIVYGPGRVQFYGLALTQYEDYTATINGDEKLKGYEAGTISLLRRKDQESQLNSIELSSFRSLNSSIGWLGIAASPFCAFAASYLQQKGPFPTIKDMITQINMLRTLKRKGTSLRFLRPLSGKEYEISIIVFSDASRTNDYGQLGFVAGLLFGKLKQDCHSCHFLEFS